MNAQQVADLFVEQHVLQPSQAEDVLQDTQLNGKNIEQALTDSGFVDVHLHHRHGYSWSVLGRKPAA